MKGLDYIDKKQMKLTKFCESFDIPRTTALQWVHSQNFPAYNLMGRWYIDVDEYYLWRKKQHIKNYRYA